MTKIDIFGLVVTVAPKLLLCWAVIWSFLASPFAWWISGCVEKRWMSRLGLALVVWLIVIVSKVKLFFRLLFRGVMPWTQMHAWRLFERFVKCFVQCKTDTLIIGIASVLIGANEDKELEEKIDKEIDIGIDAVIKNEEYCHWCPVSMQNALKVLFSITPSDQLYLRNAVSTIKKVDKKKWYGELFNKIVDSAKKYDLIKLRLTLLRVSKLVIDKLMNFACEQQMRDLAVKVVELRHLLRDLEKSDVRHVGEKRIARLIDDLTAKANAVGVLLYTECRLLRSVKGMKESGAKDGVDVQYVEVEK